MLRPRRALIAAGRPASSWGRIASGIPRGLGTAALWAGAVMLDAGAPGAVMFLERCAAAAGALPALRIALDWPGHVAAFPWTMAAMLLWCVHGPARADRLATFAGWQGSRRALRRLAVMPLVMAPTCLAGWHLAVAVPFELRTHAYALTMLVTPAGIETAWRMVCRWRARSV